MEAANEPAWPVGAVVVVTGAAGGVGHAVSRHFLGAGAQVYDLDRRPPRTGGGTFVETDVASEDSVDAAVAEVVRQAGPDRRRWWRPRACRRSRRRPRRCRPQVWQRTIAVNLTGVFLTCQGWLGSCSHRAVAGS